MNEERDSHVDTFSNFKICAKVEGNEERDSHDDSQWGKEHFDCRCHLCHIFSPQPSVTSPI